jgi:hypothetical protein
VPHNGHKNPKKYRVSCVGDAGARRMRLCLSF